MFNFWWRMLSPNIDCKTHWRYLGLYQSLQLHRSLISTITNKQLSWQISPPGSPYSAFPSSMCRTCWGCPWRAVWISELFCKTPGWRVRKRKLDILKRLHRNFSLYYQPFLFDRIIDKVLNSSDGQAYFIDDLINLKQIILESVITIWSGEERDLVVLPCMLLLY